MALTEATSGERLAAYVPRIVTAWAVETPATTWQVVDGSLVFVDVSGFTALSERLAKRGAIGAEELTDVISNSFTELLAVAYAEGGSLLKFGGDALLLLFDGDGHTERACRAALRMRTAMRRVGQLTTSVGNVRLRMSVGVHSGDIHLFRVGKSHKELILCGPAVTTTVEMESTAVAGEILVSSTVAAALPASAIGSAKGAGWLLRDRRVPEPAAGFPPSPDTAADASHAVPVALRDHLRAGMVEAEHRSAAIAFVHFDGTDELLAQEGPHAVAAALDELVGDVQAAAESHGVTFLASDIDHDGGKIILVAGVPRALGDDDGRLLRAVRQVMDGTRRLPLRTGVTRGPIFAGEVGPSFRRTYTVMGDAVNLAARLMAKAEPGQTLVSEGVLAWSRTAFDTTALEPFFVKGKARPVQAYALGAARGTHEVRRSAQLPFLGRDLELAQLEEAMARARAGQGAAVEICGDPGIGKTRLVEAFRTRLANGTSPPPEVRVVQCEQYESSTAYFAIRLLLRAVMPPSADADPASDLARTIEAIEPSLLPWVPLIADITDVAVPDTPETASLSPRFRRQRTNDVAVELLAAAIREPALLVFEDVHWIDDASRQVLIKLAASARTSPWLVCITRRPEGDDAGIGTAVRLEPLPEDVAASLVVAATKDTPLRPHRRVEVVTRAGGNPLFLEELLRAIADGGMGDDEILPESVEAVLASSVDALPAAERQLLKYSSVLGVSFDVGLLERVTAELVDVDVAAALGRLGDHVVFEADGRVRFRHRLFRDVAYRTLPFRRRQELHRRAAEAIEADLGADGASERAAVLSLHFHQAQAWEQAWVYSRRAGDNARAKFANVEASRLYERAIEASRRLSGIARAEVADTWVALAQVANLAGALGQASTALREAARLQADDPVATADIYRRKAALVERSGNHAAVRWITRALRRIEGVDSAEADQVRASLLVQYAWSRRHLGRPRDALRSCRAAVAAADASGNRFALAQAYWLIDSTHVELGEPDLAVHADEALAIFEELSEFGEHATLLNNLGAIAYLQGRWADALELYQRASSSFERVGDALYAAIGSCNVAEIFADQGHVEEAEQILHQVVDSSRSLGVPYIEALAVRHLGRIALRRGAAVDALEILQRARDTFVAAAIAPKVLEIDVLIGEAHLRLGDVDRAVGELTQALARADTGGGVEHVPAIRRLLGYAAAAEGRLLDAWSDLDASLATARRLGARYDVALTLEAMSVVAELGGPATDPAAADERAAILASLSVDAPPPPPI